MSLLDKTNLGITGKYREEVEGRDIVHMQLKEAIDIQLKDFNIYSSNLDKNTLYVTEKGILMYLRNDGFYLYFYKEDVKKYISLELSEFLNPYRGKFKTCKNGELTERCELACEILGISYKHEPIKKVVDSTIINNKIDFEVNCWECGSLLNLNGECDTCGCSSEI